MAVRLSKYINELISPAQSAFIKRRYIHDNFLFVRNLAHAYHRKKIPALLFKLDISKAFDTVSWEYMLELLEMRGFGARWREWLTIIFSTAHSTVLLNGTEGKQIRHARGLRQGDPLSPYLFILAIDALHQVLEQATADGILSPLRGREAKLRLSLYADDTVVFLNPVKEEVVAFFDILDRFGSATGLRLNLEKCIVALIRCAELNLDNILEGFTGKRMNFPLTYLGLPLTLGRTKMAHVQGIIDGSRCHLAGWHGRLLNPVGRRELVRSVLTAIPIYLMTSIRMPKQLIKDIDKLRHRFFWAGDSEISGGKCKVAWTAVTKPVEFGGLGVIELQRFSRALRLRWLWFQWTNPERPWNGTKVPVDSTNLALFNAATTISIGDGRKTSFWHNNWLNGETP
jgi:mannosylglycoprotein endo-beta-mannosidase